MLVVVLELGADLEEARARVGRPRAVPAPGRTIALGRSLECGLGGTVLGAESRLVPAVSCGTAGTCSASPCGAGPYGSLAGRATVCEPL
jgi:hypothetical protein